MKKIVFWTLLAGALSGCGGDEDTSRVDEALRQNQTLSAERDLLSQDLEGLRLRVNEADTEQRVLAEQLKSAQESLDAAKERFNNNQTAHFASVEELKRER